MHTPTFLRRSHFIAAATIGLLASTLAAAAPTPKGTDNLRNPLMTESTRVGAEVQGLFGLPSDDPYYGFCVFGSPWYNTVFCKPRCTSIACPAR